MKRIFALLFVPITTLTGCTSHNNPGIQDNYYACQYIIRQMYEGPHRYRLVGGNKHLATTQAKLQKEYQYYDCNRYEQTGQ